MARRTQMMASAMAATATTAWRSMRSRSRIGVTGLLLHRSVGRAPGSDAARRSAAARGRGHEAQNRLHHGRWRLVAEALDRVRHREPRAIQDSIGPADRVAVLGGQAGAAHADHVDTAHFRVADDEHVRGDVLRHAREAADHRELADTDELMDCDVARHEHALAERHTTSQQRAVGDGHSLAGAAIVRDVAARHQVIVGAEHGGAVLAAGAMDRGVFANHSAWPNDGGTACRLRTAHLCGKADSRAEMQLAVRADLYLLSDERRRNDARPIADARAGLDDG